jgi:hypothetical protein
MIVLSIGRVLGYLCGGFLGFVLGRDLVRCFRGSRWWGEVMMK